MWKAGPIYVFPSEGLQTHLSLNVQTASEETVYGCFFNYPLEAGKPYRFVSTGDGEISLEGNNQIAGWTPEVSEEFPFENMTEEGELEEPDVLMEEKIRKVTRKKMTAKIQRRIPM